MVHGVCGVPGRIESSSRGNQVVSLDLLTTQKSLWSTFSQV